MRRIQFLFGGRFSCPPQCCGTPSPGYGVYTSVDAYVFQHSLPRLVCTLCTGGGGGGGGASYSSAHSSLVWIFSTLPPPPRLGVLRGYLRRFGISSSIPSHFPPFRTLAVVPSPTFLSKDVSCMLTIFLCVNKDLTEYRVCV